METIIENLDKKLIYKIHMIYDDYDACEIKDNDDGTCNVILPYPLAITYSDDGLVILTKSGVLIILKSNEFSRIIIQ